MSASSNPRSDHRRRSRGSDTRNPDFTPAPPTNPVKREPDIVYVDFQRDPNPSLPQIDTPPWLVTFRNGVGPPIEATSNSRRYPAPSNESPLTTFIPMINASTVPAPRWVHIGTEGKPAVLIFTDGAALNNGRPDARGGCGIVVDSLSPHGVSFPLGPKYHPATSNRAEMLAVIAALMMRVWQGEGFGRIVIATDSEYVVRGICEWVFVWKRRNWTTRQGRPVANKDLWERLIEEVERWEHAGIRVLFYLVERRFNTRADQCARAGAAMD